MVKAKTSAVPTVMRSRLRSTTVEPAAALPDAATEHVGQPAPAAAVQQDKQDQQQRHEHVHDDDDAGQHR